MQTVRRQGPVDTAVVVRLAECEGFLLAGVLSPVPTLDVAYAHLQTWLQQGRQASMQWMSHHGTLRHSPATLLEGGAQSLLMVGLPYRPPQAVEARLFGPRRLKVARYALGKDYHGVVRQKLKRVLRGLQTVDARIQGRVCVDSAPLMEKPLAQLAGLGWLGKNGLLIHPVYGSYFFLGALLLNVPLEPRTAMPVTLPDTAHCGRCTRCLEACPTQAIVAPTVVDSARCLAYWTIENAAPEWPTELMAAQDGWVFGCDICQEVCPWNVRFGPPTQQQAFASPRPWLDPLNPAWWMSLTPEQFDSQMTATPLRRTGLWRLQRNIRAATHSCR